ncbi:hypothetical protein [Sphingobacterium pedocola]|uniref:hypothetical protein n=1 Tax=Sphingobacterium pedocola TaxID=2082722 RepID=UPI0018CA4E6A|nr:hypothetical protein [Sphingobacterium pedocola]
MISSSADSPENLTQPFDDDFRHILSENTFMTLGNANNHDNLMKVVEDHRIPTLPEKNEDIITNNKRCIL